MMKYKTFASFELVIFILFPWEIPVFFPLMIFVPPLKIIAFTLGIYLFVSTVAILIYRNAFDIVQMDSEGVRNKNVCLKWDEVNYIEVCIVELFKYSLLPTKQIEILVLSAKKEQCSFMKTNRNCVFISMSERNLTMLAGASKEKSVVLKEYLKGNTGNGSGD